MPGYMIETYGCQMNLADSKELESMLKQYGWNKSNKLSQSDFVILNTCSVRKTAENRIIGRLGYYKNKKEKNKFILILMGCFAQKDGARLKKTFPFIDFIIGTQNKNKFLEILKNKIQIPVPPILTSLKKNFDFLSPVPDPVFPYRSYISIIKGCNNFCTYCIVPYTRGKEISISSTVILKEIDKLTKIGVTEVFLLGQNVNSYGKDINDISFSRLLQKISDIHPIKRIKFLTSHPKDFSDELIDMVTSHKKISKYIHLPIQSGSDKILKLMNRKYTLSDYMKIIEKLRNKNEGISLSTDILVGFPGEDKKEYQKTYESVKNIEFDKAFVFMYSPREGTKSYPLQESVTLKEKKERIQEIVELQNKITIKKLKRFLNRELYVIPENISKKDSSQLMGMSEYENRVVFPGNQKDIGKILKVRINDLNGHTLVGNRI